MDNEHVTTVFVFNVFKNILNNWPFWADGLNKLCVSLVRDFALLVHLFGKKTKFSCILKNFVFGILDVDLCCREFGIYLRSRHAFVVRGQNRNFYVTKGRQ